MTVQTLDSRDITSELWWELNQTPAGMEWIAAASGDVVDSDSADETYVDLGAVPQLRRWRGPRAAEQMRADEFTIVNDDFEATLRIARKGKRRDKTGKVQRRINDLVLSYNMHWWELVTDLIMDGEDSICFDGQFFFDTDHASDKSGTQSNDITSAAVDTAVPTSAEVKKALYGSIQKMMEQKDDQGRAAKRNVQSFLCMIPPSFIQPFEEALNAQVISQTTNVIVGQASGRTIQLVINADLASDSEAGSTKWTTKFLLLANDGRAIIRQQEEGPLISAKAEGSEYEHDTGQHEYGVYTSRAAGYGDWKSGVLTTFT